MSDGPTMSEDGRRQELDKAQRLVSLAFWALFLLGLAFAAVWGLAKELDKQATALET